MKMSSKKYNNSDNSQEQTTYKEELSKKVTLSKTRYC